MYRLLSCYEHSFNKSIFRMIIVIEENLILVTKRKNVIKRTRKTIIKWNYGWETPIKCWKIVPSPILANSKMLFTYFKSTVHISYTKFKQLGVIWIFPERRNEKCLETIRKKSSECVIKIQNFFFKSLSFPRFSREIRKLEMKNLRNLKTRKIQMSR